MPPKWGSGPGKVSAPVPSSSSGLGRSCRSWLPRRPRCRQKGSAGAGPHPGGGPAPPPGSGPASRGRPRRPASARSTTGSPGPPGNIATTARRDGERHAATGCRTEIPGMQRSSRRPGEKNRNERLCQHRASPGAHLGGPRKDRSPSTAPARIGRQPDLADLIDSRPCCGTAR